MHDSVAPASGRRSAWASRPRFEGGTPSRQPPRRRYYNCLRTNSQGTMFRYSTRLLPIPAGSRGIAGQCFRISNHTTVWRRNATTGVDVDSDILPAVSPARRSAEFTLVPGNLASGGHQRPLVLSPRHALGMGT